MNRITEAYLLTETITKDSHGQSIPTVTKSPVIGKVHSVYQREFYQAEQNGIRLMGVLEISWFDYARQEKLEIDGETYTIYRTYEIGTDRIDLYYGKRVGNG